MANQKTGALRLRFFLEEAKLVALLCVDGGAAFKVCG